MGRIYDIELPCGCLISEDGGGGLIPCDPEVSPRCHAPKYLEIKKLQNECDRLREENKQLIEGYRIIIRNIKGKAVGIFWIENFIMEILAKSALRQE